MKKVIHSIENKDYDIRCAKMYKLSKEIVIFLKEPRISFYDYKNGNINESTPYQLYIDGKIYESKKNHNVGTLKNAYGIDCLIINDFEIALYYYKEGIFGGINDYVLFYDIRKSKK